MVLNQFFDPIGIAFFVAVAGKRVGAARTFDKDGRPDEAGLDVDRCDLADAYTDLITREQGPIAQRYRLLADLDYRRK